MSGEAERESAAPELTTAAPALDVGAAETPGVADPRARNVIGLSRAAGNAAVAGALRGDAGVAAHALVVGRAPGLRAGASAGAMPAAGPTGPMADDLSAGLQDAMLQRAVLQRNGPKSSGSTSVYLLDNIDLEGKTEEERLEILRTKPGLPGISRYSISVIWETFGDRELDVARANPDLFKQSVDKAGGIKDHAPFKGLEKEFERDVVTAVLSILGANRAFVQKEMERIGAFGVDDPKAPTPEQDAALREMQKMAVQLGRAKKAMDAMRKIRVGSNIEMKHSFGHEPMDVAEPALYDPDKPPSEGPKHGGPTWKEVDEKFKPVQAVWVEYQNASPAMLAIAESGGDPAAVAAAEPKEARAQVGKMMLALVERIEKAVPRVGGDIDYYEFIPIHAELFSGQRKGMTDWSKPVEQAVARDFVSGHQLTELLTSLGLGLVAAAAFILAEFATAGMATFLLVGAGLAAGATNAAISWEKYEDLATAKSASVGPNTSIVGKEQVQSALFQAILDTVFVFIDAAGVAAGGGRAATRGAGLLEAAEKGVAESGYLALKEANAGGAAVVERAVLELGAQESVTRSGKTADQLIAIAGEKSEAAAKLRAFKELGQEGAKKAAEDAAANLAKLGELVAKGEKAEIQKIVLAAYDQFGYVGTIKRAGGWKSLTAAIGKDSSAAGDLLMKWRDGLLKDLEEYIAKETAEQGQAVRTGTQTNVTNDMDVSMFGDAAAQNAEKAKQFLAARAGIGSHELDSVLNAELFVDPSRMHLQDVAKGLSPELRREISRSAAKYEEQMIFGRRLFEASTDEAKAAVREEAQALGITPWEGYKPAGAGEVATKQTQIDGWVAKLESTTDEAARKDLIEKIGRNQGEILAAGEGGYATGGGVRVNVSDRPGDAGRIPVKVRTPLYPEQRYTAILAEGPHLDRAAAALARPGTTADEAVQAIRNLGKHGERVTALLGGDVAPVAAGKGETLGNRLAKLAEDAKTGKAAERLASDADALRGEIKAYLGELKDATGKGTKALRAESELGTALTPEKMSQLQAWSSMETKVAQYADLVDGTLPAVFEGIHAAATAASQSSSTEPEPFGPPPPAPTPAVR